jgi:hypothetical protein
VSFHLDDLFFRSQVQLGNELKLFRPGKLVQWQVQEKETIDEVIFRTTKVKNRLMLELMARGEGRTMAREGGFAHY